MRCKNISINLQSSISVFVGCVALGGMSILLKQNTGNSLASIFLFASLLMLFAPFKEYLYWNRPEQFLILVSVIALLAASRMPILLAAVGVGVSQGSL